MPVGSPPASPRVSPPRRPHAHLGGRRGHSQHDGHFAAPALLPGGAWTRCPHLAGGDPKGFRGLIGLRVREHWHGERWGVRAAQLQPLRPPPVSPPSRSGSLWKRCWEFLPEEASPDAWGHAAGSAVGHPAGPCPSAQAPPGPSSHILGPLPAQPYNAQTPPCPIYVPHKPLLLYLAPGLVHTPLPVPPVHLGYWPGG